MALGTAYEWDLGLHGDLLERREIEFIRSEVGIYEDTWKLLIGHSGIGLPAPLISTEGSTADSSTFMKKRQRFAQYHYTLLDALSSVRELYDDMRRPVHYSEDNHNFRIYNNNFILFHAHLGRVRDAVFKGLQIFGEKPSGEFGAKVKSLYDVRNIVLHGPRVPFRHINTLLQVDLYIIEPSEEGGKWHDTDSLWTDYQENVKGMVKLSDYCKAKYDLAMDVAIEAFTKMNNQARVVIAQNKVTLPAPLYANYDPHMGQSGELPKTWEATYVGGFTQPLSGQI